MSEMDKDQLKKEIAATIKGYYGTVYPGCVDDIMYDFEQNYENIDKQNHNTATIEPIYVREYKIKVKGFKIDRSLPPILD